jgi:hypothetical protein
MCERALSPKPVWARWAISPLKSAEPGSRGPLCSLCLPNYYGGNQKRCTACGESSSGSIGGYILVGVVILAMLSLLISGFVRSIWERMTKRQLAPARQPSCLRETSRKLKKAMTQAASMVNDGKDVDQVARELRQASPALAATFVACWGLRELLPKLIIKLKVLISLMQIMRGIRAGGTPLPLDEAVDTVLQWSSVFEVDIFDMLPVSCFITYDFHIQIMQQTITPIALVGLLGGCARLIHCGTDDPPHSHLTAFKLRLPGLATGSPSPSTESIKQSPQASTRRRSISLSSRGTPELWSWLANQLDNAAFLVIFLVYPSVSANLFKVLHPAASTYSFPRAHLLS